MERCTFYKLLTIKNHMTLSLFIVYTAKCQFFTIPDTSLHFDYDTGYAQSVYIFHTLFMNKIHNVCCITGHLHSFMRRKVSKM